MPSAELACIDTSAWIEYLRNSHHPVVLRAQELLLAARVCLADVVVGELFQGARGVRERQILEEFAETLPTISGTPQTWKKAGELSARLKAHGTTVHLIDCYLATLAQEHRVSILTCDHHFTILRTHLSDLHAHVISA